ncbi:Protein FAR1-RELATED SEQUENCE 5 [Bienertia sinuspersici]
MKHTLVEGGPSQGRLRTNRKREDGGKTGFAMLKSEAKKLSDYVFVWVVKMVLWGGSMIPEENIQIVTLIDHKRNSKMHTVRHHLENNSAECTCKMYEREGIPCRHILWVIKEKGLKSLPAAYIKTRWTKAAMNMPMFDLGGNLIEDTTNMEAVKKKVGHLWSEIFTCVSMAENNEDCLDDFMKLIDGFKQSLLSRGNLQASADKGKQMETLLDSDNNIKLASEILEEGQRLSQESASQPDPEDMENEEFFRLIDEAVETELSAKNLAKDIVLILENTG